MAARYFPTLKPSSRSYSPGEFPQSFFRAQNGATTTIRFTNVRSNSELSLTFANITDAEAATILDNYVSVNSVWDYVVFRGTDVLVGLSSQLQSYVGETANPQLRWRYAEPPQVESVKPGTSTVTCRFTGFLDGA